MGADPNMNTESPLPPPPAPPGLSWVPAKSAKPCTGIVAGLKTDGRKVRIARAHQGDQLAVAALVDGDKTASVPIDGKAIQEADYEVLLADDAERGKKPFRWTPATLGDVPEGAVCSGFDERNHPIFVAKALAMGMFLPAKLLPRAQRAFVPYLHYEFARKDYHVLCVDVEAAADNAKAKAKDEANTDNTNTNNVDNGVETSKSDDTVKKDITPTDGGKKDSDTTTTQDDDKETEEHQNSLKEAEKAAPTPEQRRQAVVGDKRIKKLPPLPGGLEWVYAEDGDSPSDSVNSDGIIVVRAPELKELASGSLRENQGTAAIPYHKVGVAHSEYEVLVNHGGKVKLEWLAASLGELPTVDDESKFGKIVPIVAGIDNFDELIYVSRGLMGTKHVPGKMLPRMGKTFIAAGGKEAVRTEYEVLCAVTAVAKDDKSDAGKNSPTGTPSSNDLKELKDRSRDSAKKNIEEENKKKPSISDLLPPGCKWVDAKDGEIPDNAIIAGHANGDAKFIARAPNGETILCGSVCRHDHADIPVPAKNIVAAEEHYSVLTVDGKSSGSNSSNTGSGTTKETNKLKWVPCYKGAPLPAGAIQGGVHANNVPCYIVRVEMDNKKGIALGMVCNGEKAKLAWDDKVVSVSKFDILCDAANAPADNARSVIIGVPKRPIGPLPYEEGEEKDGSCSILQALRTALCLAMPLAIPAFAAASAYFGKKAYCKLSKH